MMTFLQWSGVVGVTCAYLFYVTRPALAACITIAGCLGLLTWALLLDPIAWGVVALEGTVIGISIRNLWIMDQVGG